MQNNTALLLETSVRGRGSFDPPPAPPIRPASTRFVPRAGRFVVTVSRGESGLGRLRIQETYTRTNAPSPEPEPAMFNLTSTLERTALAAAAVALSVATLLAATVVPMRAEPATIVSKGTPTVETVLVSYEPVARGTRLN